MNYLLITIIIMLIIQTIMFSYICYVVKDIVKRPKTSYNTIKQSSKVNNVMARLNNFYDEEVAFVPDEVKSAEEIVEEILRGDKK